MIFQDQSQFFDLYSNKWDYFILDRLLFLCLPKWEKAGFWVMLKEYWSWCSLFLYYITQNNRFHVGMCLFSNRSQITSKCGENSDTLGYSHFFVLTTFWRHLWSINEQMHSNKIHLLSTNPFEVYLSILSKQIQVTYRYTYLHEQYCAKSNSSDPQQISFLFGTFWRNLASNEISMTFPQTFKGPIVLLGPTFKG